MAVLTIAGLTIAETARRRLLLALVLLSVAAVALTGWGFSRIPLIAGPQGSPLPALQVLIVTSQLLILVMFMFSFVLALSAVFVSSAAVAGEIESGVALALVARPIHRREVILGKWLGYATLVAFYAVSVVAAELAVVKLGTGYVPPDPLGLAAYLVAEGVVLLTLTLALSTRLSGMVVGVIVLALFGLAWLGGIVGGIGVALGNEAVANAGAVTKMVLPSDGLWRGAVFSLQPAVLAAAFASGGPAVAASPFAAAAPPAAGYLLWCAVWVGGVLTLAMWSFHSREI